MHVPDIGNSEVIISDLSHKTNFKNYLIVKCNSEVSNLLKTYIDFGMHINMGVKVSIGILNYLFSHVTMYYKL